MSVRVMSLVWDSDVPAAQRLTLLALADRADEDGYCWPAVATLMQKCHSGESTIRRHLKELEEMGVLRVERRPNKVSEYFIQLDRLRDPSRSETSRSETSRSETPTSRSETTDLSNRDLQRSQIGPQYISDSSVDPSVIHQGVARKRAAPKTKRASRLPDDFAVTPEMVAWARTNVPHVDGRLETEKFRDHWLAASGANARKLDWVAAWRNWMRNADQRSPGNRGQLALVAGQGPTRPSTTDARVAQALALAARYEQEENE